MRLKRTFIFLCLLLLARVPAIAQYGSISTLIDNILNQKDFKKRQERYLVINDSLDNTKGHMYRYYFIDSMINICHRNGNSNLEAVALMSMGNFYLTTSNNFNAIEAFNKAIDIWTKSGDNSGLNSVYTNIGNAYFYMGDLNKALLYYDKSVECYKKIPNPRPDQITKLATSYNNLGGVYCSKGDMVYGRTYFELALEIWKKTGDSISIGYVYNNFGKIFMEADKTDSALIYFQKARRLKMKFGELWDKADAHLNIAALYILKKDTKQGIRYIDSALSYLDPKVYSRHLVNCYENYMHAYQQMNDCSNELKYFKLYKAASDSVRLRDQSSSTARLELKFEFGKIHLADSLRNIEEVSMQKRKLVEKKKESYFLIFILLLAFIALVLIYSRFKITKKQKLIIEDQKAMVDVKNREIIESINYAKRLQEAIMPSMSQWKNILPDSFIFYKPKDIVAGDFYWMEAHDNGSNVLVAVADCTGHGVPGAMVSVVCSNALNRAVKEFGIEKPGMVLDKVRELVIETFEKSENDVKDGMDISLLHIDRKNSLIEWSGAHNRLLYLLNGELIELKADRQPIGKSDHGGNFTTHSIPFLKGTVFYLFTDGILDQFGGEKMKKYTINNFKSLLLGLKDMNLNDQYQAIVDKHQGWKGQYEQIDDITVIGIKL